MTIDDPPSGGVAAEIRNVDFAHVRASPDWLETTCPLCVPSFEKIREEPTSLRQVQVGAGFAMDTLSPTGRSENMRRIRSQDTKPELAVRRYLHSRGLRFRLRPRDLPGKPDLVFRSRKVCVFVHGCFWHGCPRCIDGTRAVKSNAEFWKKKIEGNRARDQCNARKLLDRGWYVLKIWECQTIDSVQLAQLEMAIRNQPIQTEHATREGRTGLAPAPK
jgi:DNA mismatch endonuclease (patch repair protein)